MRGKTAIVWGAATLLLGMLWGIAVEAGTINTPGDNVGIGTAVAPHKLEVLGASGVGIGTTTAADALVVASNGNVGIGTAVPAYKLDVNGQMCVRSSSGIVFSNNTNQVAAVPFSNVQVFTSSAL